MKKTSLVSGFILVILLAISTSLMADDQVVINNNDSGAGSLRQAIADVGIGETITFDTDYTITLSSHLAIGKSLTITGNGTAGTIIQAHSTTGFATDRVFLITSGTVILSNMTIQNGRVPSAEYGGGGIKIDGAASVTLNNCDILNNQYITYGYGGGIYCWYGDETITNIEINDCTISNNTVNQEGGSIHFLGSGVSAVISNSTFSGNTSESYGGGVYIDNDCTLNYCTLSGNSAPMGGGICFDEGGTLNDCTLNNNLATSSGGGVYFYLGGTLNNCTISGNSAVTGGGLEIQNLGTVNNCTITWNTTTYYGGGASLEDGGTLNNCELTWNTTTLSYGGGVAIQGGGTLNNCTLSGNTATSDYGGGAYLYFGGILNNCIVWANTANLGGNDICIYNSYSSVLYTCASDGLINGIDGCITDDPLFVDPVSDDYHLQTSSPCIDTGDPLSPLDPDGTRADMGAYFYDQSAGITSPENVIITLDSDSVYIVWNEVSGATSYKIYSSDDPYTGFTEDISGSFNGEGWSAPIGDIKKFYYVTAEN